MKLSRRSGEKTHVVVDGSSKLSKKDQDDYLDRFGARYVYVQWQPQIPSRRDRRRRSR